MTDPAQYAVGSATAQFLLQRAKQRVSILALEMRRAALDALTVALAGILMLAAMGCAAAALWLALAPVIGAAGAALATASALLLLGGGVIWARRIAKPRRNVVSSAPNLTAPDFQEVLTQAFVGNKLAFLIGAIAAGATAAEMHRGK